MSARCASTSANAGGLGTRSTKTSSGASSRTCWCRKSAPSSGAFRHSSAWPPSYQKGSFVATKDYAALLVARRVGDHQVVRPAARDLAPRAEDVVRQEARARQPVELVVVLPAGDGAAPHVHVHHLGRAGAQRRHREGAGVGEQVQHPGAPAGGGAVRGHVARHPAAALGHVEEQAVVLPLEHVHAVARAVFGHHVRIGHATGHQPRVGRALQAQRLAALLEHPVQRLPRRQLCPARLQRGAHGGQLRLGGGREARQHEDRRVGIQRPWLAPRMQAAPAVEDAPGIGRQGHGGNGVEQGLHLGVCSIFGLQRLSIKRCKLSIMNYFNLLAACTRPWPECSTGTDARCISAATPLPPTRATGRAAARSGPARLRAGGAARPG